MLFRYAAASNTGLKSRLSLPVLIPIASLVAFTPFGYPPLNAGLKTRSCPHSTRQVDPIALVSLHANAGVALTMHLVGMFTIHAGRIKVVARTKLATLCLCSASAW